MAIWEPLFNGTDWNEVQTALRTSRLISLAHLSDPECPKCGLMRAKMGQNRLKIDFWPHKSAHRAYFGLEGVEQGCNTNKDIQVDQYGPFATP